MLRLTFLVAYLTFGKCYSEEDSSILTRIPDIIGEFCPGANVCRKNQSVRAAEMTFKPGLESCCTECSCETDCARHGNCCFPDKETVQHDDHDRLTILPDRRQCLFPMTYQPKEGEQVSYLSYYMVSSVEDTSHHVRKLDSNSSCGDEIVAPWGSLYPVYSASNKLIYKNMACATARGVTDGILWDAILTCLPDMFHQRDASSISVLEQDSDSSLGYCDLHFVYPGDIRDLKALKCYMSPINTCSDNEFQIPSESGVSKEDIFALCTSGFVSPYKAYKMFANVFCHICNGERFFKMKVCVDLFSTQTTKVSYKYGFKVLLDFEFINSVQNKKNRLSLKIPMACDIKNDSRCRPIFCPSGQLRDIRGNCRYPSKLWYDQEYTISINLTTDESFNIAEVFHSMSGENNNILPAFKSPWPKKWFINLIYTYNDLVDRTVDSKTLFVILKSKISSIQPHYLVQTIERSSLRYWILEHNNVTIVFKPAFAKYTTSTLSKRDETQIEVENRSLYLPTFQKLYDSQIIQGNTHFITKLYFCNHVELIQSDFILSADNKILFNLITLHFMFDGEFILISSNLFDGVRARICIEDSGMHKIETGIAAFPFPVLSFLFTELLIVALYLKYWF